MIQTRYERMLHSWLLSVVLTLNIFLETTSVLCLFDIYSSIMLSVVMRQRLLSLLDCCSAFTCCESDVLGSVHLIYVCTYKRTSSSCRSRCDKDCFNHLTIALHLSLCCESDVHESVFMSLSFRFLLMVSLNRRRGRPLFL